MSNLSVAAASGSSVKRSGSISDAASSEHAGALVAAPHVKDVRSQVYETLAQVGVPEKICQFFADVLQTEYDMNVTVDRLLHRLRNFDGKPLDPEAAFKVTQELTKNFHTWKNSLDCLAVQGRELPSLTVDAATMNDSMVALCGYQSHQMIMSPGDQMQIVDSTQPGKILVRSMSGQQGYIPALCCLLPSPDYTPKATICRLKVQLLAQWTESVKAIQVQLSHCLSSTVSSLTKHWRSQCAHSCGMSKDRVTRRLKRVTDTLNKARGTTHASALDYTRLHTNLFSLEKELLSLEQKPEVKKMVNTVANLDRAILCYQMLHKQWQQHREALEKEKQPIRVMEQWPARPGKNIKYYEYKVTLENVNTKEEITVVQPEDQHEDLEKDRIGKDQEKDRIEKWIVETSETVTDRTNTHTQSPAMHRKTIDTLKTEDSNIVQMPNGDFTFKPEPENQDPTSGATPLIIGGTKSENQAKQKMIDNWVESTVSEVKSGDPPTDVPKLNGHQVEVHTTTEVTEEWSETQNTNPTQGAQVPTTQRQQNSRPKPDEQIQTEEWTEVTKTEFSKEVITNTANQKPVPSQDVTRVTESVTQVVNSHPEEQLKTEEWTEENKTCLVQNSPPVQVQEQWKADERTEEQNIQFQEEVVQELKQNVTPEEEHKPAEYTEEPRIRSEKDVVQEPQIEQAQEDEWFDAHTNQLENQIVKPPPQMPQEEQWRTDEWTEEEKLQYEKETILEQPLNSQEQQRTDEWTNEQKIQFENEVAQEPPYAATQEQRRTDELTEEEKTQYEKEITQEQPLNSQEQWRTDEWTEEEKTQYEKQVIQEQPTVTQEEEQWRTDGWTEEQQIQSEREVPQEPQPQMTQGEHWRTDEWTEEEKFQYEKETILEQPLNSQEQQRTDEWTEEQKTQFKREVVQEQPTVAQEEAQWQTNEWTEEQKNPFEKVAPEQPTVAQEEEQWRTEGWTEEQQIQFERKVPQEPQPQMTQGEHWRTDERTEEEKFQYEKEVTQEQPPNIPEQQKTDEWTEEQKTQFKREVVQEQPNNIQQEEQWRTNEWTEEQKIQFEREAPQEPQPQPQEQWRTDEWTEEEKWTKDEWTEERKIQFEREVPQEPQPQMTQGEHWRTDERTAEEKFQYEKEATQEQPLNSQEQQRTDEWTEEQKTQFKREVVQEQPNNIRQEEQWRTDEWTEENTVPFEKVTQEQPTVTQEEEQWRTDEWTEEQKIQFEREVPQEPQPEMAQEPWRTDEWTEEQKIQFQKEITQEQPITQEKEQGRTDEWTQKQKIQFEREVPQEPQPQPQPQPQEPWRADEWTEEQKIQFEKEVVHEQPNNIQQEEQWRTDGWTEGQKIQFEKEVPREPRPEATQEQWRTDEWTEEEKWTKDAWTEERKIQFEREVPQEPQPEMAQEPWRNDEWTEAQKIQFQREVPQEQPTVTQGEEQWRTDGWTEEQKIQFERETPQEPRPEATQEQWRTDEWTEEEKWTKNEWTEERKIQFEREVAQEQATGIQEAQRTEAQIQEGNIQYENGVEKQQVKDLEAPKYEASRKSSIQTAAIKEVQPLSCQSDSGGQAVRRLSDVRHITQFIKSEEPVRSLDEQDSITRQQQFVAAGIRAEESGEAVETVTMDTSNEAGVTEEEREWTVTSGCTQTVYTDQIVSVRGEEVRHFFIKGIVDPETGKDINVQEAHEKGIVRDGEGVYYNKVTDTKIPIQEAMNQKLIKVAYQTSEKAKEEVSAVGMITIKYSVDPMITKVIDEATGEEMTCEEAQLRGILDDKCEIYTTRQTGERFAIDDALEKGWIHVTPGEFHVKTYAVSAVMDQRAKRKVPFAQAIEKNLFDRKTGHYINNVTGERVYVTDAISRRYLQAKLVDNNQTLDIQAENKMIVDRMENMRSTVLEKLGQLTDSLEHLQ